MQDKHNFILGLSVGIAIVSLGAAGLMYFNGGGFKKNNTGQGDTVQVDDTKNNPADDSSINGADNNSDQAENQKVDISVNNNDWARGKKDAKVTIVEFSDLQCPYCSRHHDTMLEVMKNFPNDVRWIFKHYPLESIHPYALKASEASECAGEQKKFWEYIDYVFADQDKLDNDFLITAASAMKLDAKKFKSCLDTGKYKDKVKSDIQDGNKYGVRGTPGTFINGVSLPGAVPYSQIESVIKEQL